MLTLPCRKVSRLVNEAWPYWSCIRLSLAWSRWNHRPKSNEWPPRVNVAWSDAVNKLRTAARLLPAFVPPLVICEAPLSVVPPPTTTAPAGCPGWIQPARFTVVPLLK